MIEPIEGNGFDMFGTDFMAIPHIKKKINEIIEHINKIEGGKE